MYQHILIATDGSELSHKAVSHGLALAALGQAKVSVLKVVPNYPRNYFEGGLPIEAADIARVEQQWRTEAEALVDKVKAEGNSQGVAVQALIVQSDLVAEAIIESAQTHGCDLIVMASHGRRGLQRLLLGSETQHVLTHSHVPVLVLR
ncbi:universal stress protein [Acidovorax sp. HDW3]|uniref:universal stress protein n=1 Tax=Acidovorax sp. HDW3 TaxID=2714923 RepID=UPI0014099E4E|nr:universal stress protein [Acidovorax sp. HDW3]QIL43628.1 universal stress protein [Acidovorax sp. HDW3]